jgi:hypothetical protein
MYVMGMVAFKYPLEGYFSFQINSRPGGPRNIRIDGLEGYNDDLLHKNTYLSSWDIRALDKIKMDSFHKDYKLTGEQIEQILILPAPHPTEMEAYNIAIISTEAAGAAGVKTTLPQIIIFSLPEKRDDDIVQVVSHGGLREGDTCVSIFERVCNEFLGPEKAVVDSDVGGEVHCNATLSTERQSHPGLREDVEG